MGIEQSDIRTWLRVLWRWKLLILAIVVVIPVAAYVYASSKPKVYASSALLQVQALAVDTSLFGASIPAPQSQTLLSAARLVTTTAVAQTAAEELGEPRSSGPSLLAGVTATADVQADFITIAAQAATPERAADVANAFAEAVVTTRSDQAIERLNTTIGKVQQQLSRISGQSANSVEARTQLSEQLARLRALRAAQGNNARVVEPAVAIPVPVAPRVRRTVILALIIAVLLAFGAVVLAQGSDRKVRDPNELEDLTGRPLLSAVPRSAFGEEPDSATEEAFQTLRASLTYFNVDREINSVLITSPAQGDGKTTVATNLARAMARAGKDVILVDADLRRPQVASRLHVYGGVAGLGGVLVGQASLAQAFEEPEVDTLAGRLRVLPAGHPPPNPSELLASQRMRRLIEKLTEACDLVIVDSTPLLTVSDSLPLVEVVSGTVLIARVNETSKDAVKRLQSVIINAGGTLLGSVATGTAASTSYGGYGYGYESASRNGAGHTLPPRPLGQRPPGPPAPAARGRGLLRWSASAQKMPAAAYATPPERPPDRKKNGRLS